MLYKMLYGAQKFSFIILMKLARQWINKSIEIECVIFVYDKNLPKTIRKS